MRAVAIAEDRSLVTTEAERPLPGEGEVVVEVAFCGICGSDLHLRPSPAIAAGSIMGHELSGRVAELGEGVEGWEVGERVCVFPFAPCGECEMCLSGAEHLCAKAATTGIGLGARPGGFAEAILVPASTLYRIPEEVSDEQGALVEPLAVALHGVELENVGPEAPAAVIGAGPIGVMCALALRARGFENVVVIERNDRRRDRVAALGFDVVGLDGVHMAVVERLGGLPPAVFECAGNPAALGLGLELVRPAGTIVALGVLEEPVHLSQLLLILKEARIQGSFAYRGADFAAAIELLAGGRVPTEGVLTGVEPLERAEEMFAQLVRPDTGHVKVLLRP